MITTISIVCECIATLIDSSFCYICFRTFKKDKSITIFDIIYILLNSSIIIFINYTIDLVSPLTLLASYVLWIAFGLHYSGKNKLKDIILQLLLVTFTIHFGDTFALFIAQILFDIPVTTLFSSTLQRVFSAILSKALLIANLKFILSIKIEYITSRVDYFFKVCFLLISHNIISYLLIIDILHLDSLLRELSLNTYLVMIILNFTVLTILILINNFAHRHEYLNIIEDNYELQKIIINEQKLNIQNIRKIQHEYKNNLSTINALLMNENIEEAKLFLRETLKINNKTSYFLKNSSFFEIIINYKFFEAEKNHIKTYSSINIPSDIPLNKYDIAIILNNALNNAIEACSKVDVPSRYIKCSISLKLNYLNFYFENSCINDYEIKNNKLLTTKADKSNHGFGIKNITSIVNKYDGLLNYKFCENKYILHCSLLIPKKSN